MRDVARESEGTMTLDNIYDIKVGIEEAIAAVFVAMGAVAITRKNAPQSNQQPIPRYEIRCSIGAATGRRKVFSNGTMRFDAWNISLAVQAVTSPSNDPANNAQHEAYVGRARNVMSNIAQVSWDDVVNFPSHYLAEPLRDSGTTDQLRAGEAAEYSVLNYGGIICVRSSAWPN